ncbi:MAG: DUF5687 family protein [Nonlabens sp.]
MFKHFINLEWKSFFRSAAFKQNLFFKIFIGFFAVLFLIEMAGLGAFSYKIIENFIEDGDIKAKNPFRYVNRFLIYWFVMDMVIRYFFQKMPVTNIKPLLYLPFTKGKIVKYALGKTSISFFNILPAFFFVPFSIVLLFEGFSPMGVLGWHLAALGITYSINFLNIFLNNSDKVFYPVLAIVAASIYAQYNGYFDVTVYTKPIFDFFYDQPWACLIPLATATGFAFVAYNHFLKQLYLDGGLSIKAEEASTENLDFLDRFGKISTYLKNDIKLIKRNKRARMTFIMGFIFILYPLLLTTDIYGQGEWRLIIVSIIASGGFLLSFGGLVPSWDSSYYKLMMSQNIPYREFLLSKWWLMVIVTVISMVLSLWYVYFGIEWLYAILAGAIYNIGLNSSVVLLGGAFVKTPIDLTSTKKAFGDSKAFNIKTLLLSIPKIGLPVGLYYAFSIPFNTEAGFIAIAVTGILGLAFRNVIFKWIETIYKNEKYDTIDAYSQKD